MPYTPPSQQSPASSKASSPAVSRSNSYSEDVPRSPVNTRPQLPRSHSSASYMTRHRRSPSMTSSQGPPTPTDAPGDITQATDFAHRGSIRQSPPPVNNLLIPTGAVISPPDSPEDSDGDNDKKRGRQIELRELQEAVRSIDQKKSGSPDGTTRTFSASEPVSQSTSPTALSAEARKISHSRSSTETAIIVPKATFAVSPITVTDDSDDDDDDDDDDGAPSKPSLVRKKSGELVKPALRPSSRRRYSSAPGTPTYSKSVHFNDNDNQTRHFLQVDKPMAVSAGTSPVESYESESEYPFEIQRKGKREIKLTNFPTDSFERRTRPIRVERIFLAADMETLVGKVAVQNIAFNKLVVARFTFDSWKTTSEVVAEFNNDPSNPVNDGCDRFIFQIKLSDATNVDHKTLLLCARYNVNGQEYWDNNDDKNYQVDFVKTGGAKKSAQFKPDSTLGARPLSAIPRSRHSPPATSHGRGRQDSTDDEFGTRGTSYHFGPSDNFLAESAGSIKLKPKVKRAAASTVPIGQVQVHNHLGGRYDFGVSLSAALSSAQDKLGRSSGLMGGNAQTQKGSYFGLQDRKDGPTAVKQDKPELDGDRPAIGSDQYRDLVQKFCYFTTSSTGKASASSNRTASATLPDQASTGTTSAPVTSDNIATVDDASETSSSSSASPTPQLDGNHDRTGTSSAFSPFVSRSNSPTPFTTQDYLHRAASPTSFGYPYHNASESYFDSPHPTAIQG